MNYPPKPMRGWPNTPLHQQLINDPDWIAEPKKNGHRVIVMLGKVPVFVSRRGSKISLSELDSIPQEIMKVKSLKVLDGELILKPTPTLWLFDLPERPQPLLDRRAWLAKVIEDANLVHVKLMPWLVKETAYEDCIKAGDEGVVWKRLSSLYSWQMESENTIVDWVKMKPAEKW